MDDENTYYVINCIITHCLLGPRTIMLQQLQPERRFRLQKPRRPSGPL